MKFDFERLNPGFGRTLRAMVPAVQRMGVDVKFRSHSLLPCIPREHVPPMSFAVLLSREGPGFKADIAWYVSEDLKGELPVFDESFPGVVRPGVPGQPSFPSSLEAQEAAKRQSDLMHEAYLSWAEGEE